MIKLHADKISISRLIDIEAEFVCKTGDREAVEIKRNLVSPVAQFVPLPSLSRCPVSYVMFLFQVLLSSRVINALCLHATMNLHR